MPRTADIDRTADFIEHIAIVTESEGFPRIAGRIFACLMLSPEALSLDALAARLGVSKASISQDARRLANRGVLERVGLPGDRRDYYRVPEDLFVRTMELRLERWRALHDAMASGRRTLPVCPAQVGRRLDELDSAFRYVFHAVSRALEDWRTHRTRPVRRQTSRGRA